MSTEHHSNDLLLARRQLVAAKVVKGTRNPRIETCIEHRSRVELNQKRDLPGEPGTTVVGPKIRRPAEPVWPNLTKPI